MERKIKNIIFDYGRVLVDYSTKYLYDSVFADKQEMQWFIDHVVNAEFHTTLDLGYPTQEVIEVSPNIRANWNSMTPIIYGW